MSCRDDIDFFFCQALACMRISAESGGVGEVSGGRVLSNRSRFNREAAGPGGVEMGIRDSPIQGQKYLSLCFFFF